MAHWYPLGVTCPYAWAHNDLLLNSETFAALGLVLMAILIPLAHLAIWGAIWGKKK